MMSMSGSTRAVIVLSQPPRMRRIRAPCCARAASGHYAAAPPPSVAKFAPPKANAHFHLPWQGRFAVRPLKVRLRSSGKSFYLVPACGNSVPYL
jgi:hypothetical protein